MSQVVDSIAYLAGWREPTPPSKLFRVLKLLASSLLASIAVCEVAHGMIAPSLVHSIIHISAGVALVLFIAWSECW